MLVLFDPKYEYNKMAYFANKFKVAFDFCIKSIPKIAKCRLQCTTRKYNKDA